MRRGALLAGVAATASVAVVALPGAASSAHVGPRPLLPQRLTRTHVPTGRLRASSATTASSPGFAGVPLGVSAMPATAVNVVGMGFTNTPSIITGDPPDPTGAVGPSNYVQAVNGGIQIYDKSGAVVKAAALTRPLWTG